MPEGKGFCLPEGFTMHSPDQLKRWSQMLAQRCNQGESVDQVNKEISNQHIKDKYGS